MNLEEERKMKYRMHGLRGALRRSPKTVVE